MPRDVFLSLRSSLATARRVDAEWRQNAAESAEVENWGCHKLLCRQQLPLVTQGLLIRRSWVRAPAASLLQIAVCYGFRGSFRLGFI